MNWKDARLQLVLLAFVFAAAMTHYVASAVQAFQGHLHPDTYAQTPFTTDNHAQITHVIPAAAAAGVTNNDRLLKVAGERYYGRVVLLTALSDKHAGDVLQIEVEHPDGRTATIDIKLVPFPHIANRAAAWGYFLLAEIILPLFCILVGVWVVAARPRLGTAWLMLGILLLFPTILGFNAAYGRPLIYFLPYYTDTVQSMSFVCMMLFGLYFPQRSRIDAAVPWLKWVLGVPVLLSLVPDFLDIYSLNFNSAAGSWMGFGKPLNIASQVLAMGCVSLFIFALATSAGKAATPDNKRRLRVLLYGSQIGLTPMLFIGIWSQLHGGDFGAKLPTWIVLLCVGLIFIFPLSLGYVVVVQRAMDVRILLRQGTQYALARGTLNAIRMVLYFLLALAVFQGFKHHFDHAVDVIALVVIGFILFAFRFRFADRMSAWLDRRFFRESYSAELMLAELSEEARSFTETAPLLKTITHRLAETLHIDRIAVLLRNGHTFALQQAVGLNGAMPVPVTLADSSQTIRNLNREHRPATIFHDNPDGWLFLATEQERRLLRELESEVLLPLPGRSKLVGLISLGPKRSEEPYSRADLQMLQSVAMQTGLAIENSELIGSLAREASQRERLNREIEIAREVQERLLPQTFPQISGIECSGICRPAQGVGGDYYDFLLTSNGCLGIAIGDVSGKGISAALLMAGLRASLRAVTMSGTGDLSSLMQNVNQLVFEASADNRYATFFFGVYDPATRALDYVNAGHNAPFILRPHNASAGPLNPDRRASEGEGYGLQPVQKADRINPAVAAEERQDPAAPPPPGAICETMPECAVLRLEEGGPVVGLLEGAHYHNGRLSIMPGDVLVAFTDGISEAMNRSDDEWSEDRLIAAACKCTHKSASEIVNCLVEEADSFTDGAPQHDDMTLAVVKLA